MTRRSPSRNTDGGSSPRAGRTPTPSPPCTRSSSARSTPPSSPVNALPEFSAPFAVPGNGRHGLDAHRLPVRPRGRSGCPTSASATPTTGPPSVRSRSSPRPPPARPTRPTAWPPPGTSPGTRRWRSSRAPRARARWSSISSTARPAGWGAAPRPATSAAARSAGVIRVAQPTLSWNPARAGFGPIRYTVTLDGAVLGTTTATSLTPAVPLLDGRHTWSVTAVDPVGQSSTMKPATFFVDRLAPTVTLRVQGKLIAGVVSARRGQRQRQRAAGGPGRLLGHRGGGDQLRRRIRLPRRAARSTTPTGAPGATGSRSWPRTEPGTSASSPRWCGSSRSRSPSRSRSAKKKGKPKVVKQKLRRH